MPRHRSYLEPPDYAPPAIQRLPFNLLRAHLYPRRPDLVAEGVEEFHRDEPLPVYLPQRMGFTRYKTPPWEASWGTEVAALVMALQQGVDTQDKLYNAAVQGSAPVTSRNQMARRLGASRLPEPYDHAADLDRTPYARNALPADSMLLTTDDLAALERGYEEHRLGSRYEADRRRTEALESVEISRDTLFRALGESADTGYNPGPYGR